MLPLAMTRAPQWVVSSCGLSITQCVASLDSDIAVDDDDASIYVLGCENYLWSSYVCLKDWTGKDKDKDKDLNLVLKDKDKD